LRYEPGEFRAFAPCRGHRTIEIASPKKRSGAVREIEPNGLGHGRLPQ
jgi:hypothetical protein